MPHKLRSQVVAYGGGHLLDGVPEEADVGLALTPADQTFVGADGDQHVLEVRNGPFREVAHALAPVELGSRPTRRVRGVANGDPNGYGRHFADSHAISRADRNT